MCFWTRDDAIYCIASICLINSASRHFTHSSGGGIIHCKSAGIINFWLSRCNTRICQSHRRKYSAIWLWIAGCGLSIWSVSFTQWIHSSVDSNTDAIQSTLGQLWHSMLSASFIASCAFPVNFYELIQSAV